MIKLFEEYNENSGIKEIDSNDYFIGIGKYNMDNFEGIELVKLHNFMSKVGLLRDGVYSDTISLLYYRGEHKGVKSILSIEKYQDEWFYVRFNYRGISYYKCDQFDSVLKLLVQIFGNY